MPAKMLSGKELMPFSYKASWPTSFGHTPVRASGAPFVSPEKVQSPKTTVHGTACVAGTEPSKHNAMQAFFDKEAPIVANECVRL